MTNTSMDKNTKDPTKKYFNKVNIWLVFIIAITTLLIQVPLLKAEIAGTAGIGYSWAPSNVSCIAHDAKFTCDCRNVNQHMHLPHLIGYVFQVEISNCQWLTVGANVLEETQGLRKITFRNVNKLTLQKYALAFPRYASNTPLIIEFEKVNFELIDSHAINGNIEEISFIGGRIGVMNAFGFTTLKDRAMLVKMDSVLINRIEPQAFKKFAVEQLEISNCIFESNVPSKAFYELEVLNSLLLNNNKFKEARSRAFSFKVVVKLIIANNYFEAADAEWFEASVRESVILRENYFGTTNPIAFRGIYVHRDYMSGERLELRFNNNTVRFPLVALPLNFNEHFLLSIKKLQYENYYDCSTLDTAKEPVKPTEAFFAKHIEQLYFRSNDKKNQSFVVLSSIIQNECLQPSYLLYIILGIIGLIALLILIAVLVVLYFERKRKRRKLDVVMPEPRTYKETQIIYQIENAGLLKTDL